MMIFKRKIAGLVFGLIVLVYGIQGISDAQTPLTERTQQVQDAIVAALSVASIADVVPADLANITVLDIENKGVTALQAGDFDGFTALETLHLAKHSLTALPEEIFDGLTALEWLTLNFGTHLETLPENIFDGLTALKRLDLSNGVLMALPEEIFDGLTALEDLSLTYNDLTALPKDLFDGLTALEELRLTGNALTELPEDLFDGLTALEYLIIGRHPLTELPENIFDGLTALVFLGLNENPLTELPEDLFDGLTSLGQIDLGDNDLTELPEDLFDGLTSLWQINLDNNDLTELPEDLFDGLTNLQILHLDDNALTELPENIFDGLTKLGQLVLSENTVDPLPVTVSLKKVAEGEFKATVHTGAPFAIELPVTVTNGTLDGGATTITVPTGKVESESLTVTRATGTMVAVTVDIGTLPDLPSVPRPHDGYALVKSTDPPLEIFEDVSNAAPTFSAGDSTTRSVAENTAAGEDIGSAVAATDTDTGDTLTYTLGGTDAASFDIVSTSGQLQTKSALDYETKTSYTVTVTVSDNTDTDSITVTINITNVNEAPTFPGTTATRSIAENTAASTNIGAAVSATDPDGTTDVNPEDDNVDALTYTLGGTDASSFAIVGTSGQLQTKDALDYETDTSYTVTVSVSDGTDTDSITVTINITNVNEAPKFATTTTTRSIAENAAVGTNIGAAVSATDPDGTTDVNPEDATVDALTYTLGGTDAASFNIVGTSGQLQTKVALDHETKSSYEVTVTASDGGTDTASITVTINILETTRPNVSITVPMVVQNGAFDVTVVFDEEVTGFAQSELVVTGTSGSSITTWSPQTGGTDYKATITPTSDGTAIFNVAENVAEDASSNGNTAATQQTVPVDMTQPTVSLTIPSGPQNDAFEVTVVFDEAVTGFVQSELVVTGTSGASITAWNPQTGDTDYKATITPTSSGTAIFNVAANVAEDAATNGNTAATEQTVNILIAPTFSDGESTTRAVDENTAAEENIGAPVAATDPDSGDTLTYTLGGTDASSFAIVSTSGQLQTKAALDYETDDSYSVTVSVSDGNSGTDTIDVTIDVTNVNEAPTFATTTATRSVAENTAASTNIGAAVSATDPDVAGTNTDVNPDDANVDALTYTLGGTDASSFAIVGTSGQLQTKDALDYETDNSYTVTVSVSDGTDTDTITVTINVTNINEAPTFPGTTATRSIAENTGTGENIGAAVSATDPDVAGTNTDVNPEDANVDALTYTLGGTNAASFDIVSTSGQLQTKVALDYETKSSYEVMVTVSDGGTDTDSIIVTINILDRTPPNVSITVPTVVQNGAFEVTVVFDEAVMEFEQSELVVTGTSGSSITAWNPQDGGTDYRATITPTQTGTAIFKVEAGVAEDAAENQNTAATQQTVQVNLTRPTVSIMIPSDAQNGEFEVTVVFDEAVTGFEQSELVVTGTSGSSITAWNPQTGGTDYKATITPTSGGTAIFNVAANVAEDTGGNQNTVATQQTVQVDMTSPTVSITIPSSVQNAPFDVTVVFSEAVTDFVQSELAVSGTSGSSITAWNPQDGGTDYEATITPTSSGTAIFNVAANVAVDTATNQNTAATQQTVQVNLTRPTVSITIPSDPQNGAFEVTVVFSEAVMEFEQSELVVTGTSGASITTWAPQTGGTDYKATITPTSGGTAIFNVAANVAKDTGGNQNTAATQQTVQVDMTRPTVSITIPSGVQNGAFEVTVVFSELVTDFIQSDLAVTGTSGSSITAWNPQDGGTDYKATITPTQTGTAIFKVAANVAVDTATNQNTAATQQTVQVNLTRPTVSIMIPSDAQNGEFEVTVVFSEAVTGFVQSELVVTGTSGASITTWSPQTGGTDYKATITPTSGGTAIFNVAENVAEDTGGNQNTVATQQTVQVDMTSPTVSITIPSSVQNAPFDVTVVFSEAVTDFIQSDLVVTGTSGSSITAWNPQDGGTDYEATITPTSSGTAIFNVAANVAVDTATNQNTAATQQTVQVNLTRPTVSITIPSDPQNGAFEVTVVFSEAVMEFEQSDLVVTGTSGSSITAWNPQTGGTDYKATITPTQTGTAIFNVAANVAEDAGSNGNTAATQQTVQVDMTSPTVSITIPSSVQNAPFDVTVVFSEAVTDFIQSELVVTGTSGSSITAWNPQDGGTDYKATITPTQTGTAIFNVAASVAKDTAENQNTAATEKTVQVDRTPPTVSITVPSGAQNGAFDVTVVFDEAVTGFEQSELVVTGTSGASITAWNPQTGDTDYKATITPTQTGTAIFNVAANVTEDAGSNGNTAASEQTVQVDRTPPTVSITTPSGPQNGAFDVTVVFSEEVTDFIQSELAVTGTSGSSITAWNPQDGGTDYKATITPTQTGTAIFNVAASVAKDTAENQNTAATEKTVQVDRTPPTVSITVPSGAQNAPFDVTVVFSEAVTGFVQSELVVSGTSGSSITNWSPQTGGTDYRATITPTSSGTALFNVAANVAEDAAENQNTAATQQTVQVNLTRPTVSITTPSDAQNGTFDVTVVFSEAVTGFVQSELVVSGTSGASITAWNPQTGGTDYKATITPTQTGTAIFNVAASVAVDTGGNQNTAATQKTVPVDKTLPAVSITTPSGAQNGAFEVTVIFDEAVTGFVQSELVVSGTSGASITAWNPQSGGTDYKATITPTQTGTAIFNVAASVAKDAAENQNTAATQKTVQVDRTPPTVSITIPSGAQNAPFDVTVVFSEAVTGFEQSELVVSGTSGSSITNWSPQTSGTDYRATITPTSSGTALFNVAANVAEDAAENQNAAATQQTVQVNLTRPTVSITTPSDAQKGTFDVTVVFSEAVTGFVQSELAVSGTSGASITAWNPQTGGTDYKATITPTQTGTAIFNVAENVAENAGSNGNTAATQQTVQVDMIRPTVSITIPSGAQNAPFEVTVVFSEAVTGFEQSELAVTGTSGSSITAWNPQTGGTDYKATIIPTQTGTAIFNVAENVAEDAATNGNTAASEQTVQVDKTRPTGSLEPLIAVIKADGTLYDPDVDIFTSTDPDNDPVTFSVRIDFGEAVSGFEQEDFTIHRRLTDDTLITHWEADADGERYTATIVCRKKGGVSFWVEPGVAQSVATGVWNTLSVKQVVLVFYDLGPRDDTHPFVTLTVPSGEQTDTFIVTVSFDEPVIDFTQSDLSIVPRFRQSAPPDAVPGKVVEIAKWESDADGRRYTATIKPLVARQFGGKIHDKFWVGFMVQADVASDALGNLNGSVDEQLVAVTLPKTADTTPPTVEIVVPSGNQDGAFDAEIQFSEVVTDFTQSDLQVTGTAGASLTAWATLDNTTYTATLTPTQDGDVILNVSGDVAKDAAGLGNTAATEKTITVAGFDARPTVRILVSEGVKRDPFQVTIEFSEAVTGFAQNGLTRSKTVFVSPSNLKEEIVEIVKITAWATTDNTVFTATLIPERGGTLRLDVAEAVAYAGTDANLAAPRVTVVILPEDVNHDGVVDILDLFDVAANFGKTVEDPTKVNPDVNRDGIVDTADFDLVEGLVKSGTDTLEAANNAPAIGGMFTVLDRATLEKLDPTTLKAQLDRLRAESDGSLKYQRAIALLESVLAALRPVETLLLANYPNPFNPETWIPYHLANASDVVITIYDVRGSVVRRLVLGHQREGYYTSRSRAAYWDGRNTIGERVASGIYFYQLQTENISLLRKMVILQ